jgi:hypothetical protein
VMRPMCGQRLMASMEKLCCWVILTAGRLSPKRGVHPSVRHLVYLCAMALDLGESCQTAVVENMAALSEMGDRASSTVSLWMGEALQHWIQYPQRHASITNVMSKP